MAQTKEMTTEQAHQQLREMRKEMRELRAELDIYATRIEAAGLNGEVDRRDHAAAEELHDQLDTLHTKMMALQFSPAFLGETQPMTQSMMDTERQLSRAAKADNADTRKTSLLPSVRKQIRRHRATPESVRATIIQMGRADRLA